MSKRISYCSPFIIILIIAVGSGLLDLYTPMMGDDMAKWIDMVGPSDSFPVRRVISFLAGHYVGCNGRIFDGLGPVLINLLPHSLATIVMGLMNGLFFYALALAAGVMKRERGAMASILITVALFTLPWWDSMFLRVCQINYLWGTTFALFFVNAWFSDLRPGVVATSGLFLLGILAGCFHEQIGVAMTAYFGVRVVLTGYRDKQLWMFAGLIFGTVLTLASPALWQRNTEFLADSSRLELLFTTLPWMLILVVITLIIASIPTTRTALRTHLKSEFGAYLTIAVISSAITIYSTTPGRTGWLPESFSLVAITLLITSFGWSLSRGRIAVVLLCLIAVSAHFISTIRTQYEMWHQYNIALGIYRESSDGIVRMATYTPRTAVSPITLYRVKGLPDADDTYLKRMFSKFYGSGKQKPLTLITDTSVISDTLPDSFTLIFNTVPDTIMLMDTPSGKKVITPFIENGIQKYLLEPMVTDPGDHWHEIRP